MSAQINRAEILMPPSTLDYAGTGLVQAATRFGIKHANGALRALICACGIAALNGYALPAQSQQLDAASQLTGPDAIGNRLESDAADKPDILDVDLQTGADAWKARLKERTGLDFGLDYNFLGFAATNAPDEDTSAAGAFRFYGTWELFNRGSPNNGSLVFKLENRHSFTSVPPTEFGFDIGSVSLTSSVFSDQGWRTTHLFWQQRFADGRGVAYIGFLDVTDYLDVYALASPWTGFSNLAFQTGSGTIGGLPDGALGAMVGGFLTDNVYAVGGIADANGDATDLAGEFDNFFNDFETFKSVELGWTTSQEELFLNNAHVTLWQIDERTASGSPDGWGINISLSGSTENGFLPFLRGGWSQDAGILYDASLSTGFGYTTTPGKSMLGVGLNWNRPNETTYGAGLDDQYIVEVFQQVQLTEGFEITPSIQYIQNPALNPSEDSNLLVGLRLRAAF